MKRDGIPKVIVTDGIKSCGAATKIIGTVSRQETGHAPLQVNAMFAQVHRGSLRVAAALFRISPRILQQTETGSQSSDSAVPHSSSCKQCLYLIVLTGLSRVLRRATRGDHVTAQKGPMPCNTPFTCCV